jgi:hypothetical protein
MAHADFARNVWAKAGHAPLVTEGPVWERVHARLIAQALALGWRMQEAGKGAIHWLAPAAETKVSDCFEQALRA